MKRIIFLMFLVVIFNTAQSNNVLSCNHTIPLMQSTNVQKPLFAWMLLHAEQFSSLLIESLFRHFPEKSKNLFAYWGTLFTIDEQQREHIVTRVIHRLGLSEDKTNAFWLFITIGTVFHAVSDTKQIADSKTEGERLSAAVVLLFGQLIEKIKSIEQSKKKQLKKKHLLLLFLFVGITITITVYTVWKKRRVEPKKQPLVPVAVPVSLEEELENQEQCRPLEQEDAVPLEAPVEEKSFLKTFCDNAALLISVFATSAPGMGHDLIEVADKKQESNYGHKQRKTTSQ